MVSSRRLSGRCQLICTMFVYIVVFKREMRGNDVHELEADIGKIQGLSGIGQVNCAIHGIYIQLFRDYYVKQTQREKYNCLTKCRSRRWYRRSTLQLLDTRALKVDVVPTISKAQFHSPIYLLFHGDSFCSQSSRLIYAPRFTHGNFSQPKWIPGK
jgi:hypothetical protein